MGNVGLVKRVVTPVGRRFCPVVVLANGRISPDRVVRDGKEERYPDGTFYLEWWEGSARKRQAAGKSAATAHAQRLRKEATLRAKEQGLTVTGEGPTSTRLTDAISVYLEDTRLSKKPKTLTAYRVALAYFLESSGDKTLAELDRRDLLEFSAFLREKKGQSPRSVYNKFENVMTFLKAQGVLGLAKRNDWPKFVEPEPEIYEKDDLDKLYKVCTKDQSLLFDFLLMTGVREQEAVYMTWADIDLKEATVSVRWKEEYGWTPKNYKGRTIPIPTRLAEALREAKEHARKCPLVFATKGCKPDTHMLRTLQRTAKRAGLDPAQFWLHRFRSTFATWHLWAGVDLRTVQLWMGHTDLASTMRYLKPNRGQAVRDKVNQTFGPTNP